MKQEDTIAFWDAEAKKRGNSSRVGYLAGDWPVALGDERFRSEWEWVSQHVLPLIESPHTCLDIGCGGGSWLLALASHFDQAIGLDISSSMVDLATQEIQNRNAKNARVIVGGLADLRTLPAADMVFVGGVIMCLSDDHSPTAIGQIFDVLKPGGLAVFRETTYHRKTHYRTKPLVPGLFHQERGPRPPFQVVYRPISIYKDWFQDAGFNVICTEENQAYARSDLAEEVLRAVNWISGRHLSKNPFLAEKVALHLHRRKKIVLEPLLQTLRALPRPLRKRVNQWFLVQKPL